MNVRIVPRGQPQRTDLYSAANEPLVVWDGQLIIPLHDGPVEVLQLKDVAEIWLDDEPGDW